jgi:hypothetical protein
MRKSPFLAAAVSAVIIAGPVIGLAAPAGANNHPAVTVTGPSSTVTTEQATVTYDANRGGNQLVVTGGLTCALSGPTTSSDCGTVTTSTGTTTGSVSLTGLASGTYTYTVTIVLTDGGTATGTATFTVTIEASGSCWGSTKYPDQGLTGALNTLHDGTVYVSTTGTCTGGSIGVETIVQEPNPADADAVCGGFGSGYSSADTLQSLGYSTAPTDYWDCV